MHPRPGVPRRPDRPSSGFPRPTIASVFVFACALAATTSTALRADGPDDNRPDSVRPVPPPGIDIAAADAAELSEGARRLGEAIEALRPRLDAQARGRLPDVQVLQKAVDWAIRYREIHRTNEIAIGRELLAEGWRRLGALADGRTPWLARPGPVALGYLSRIDGSVQPYGLIIPDDFSPSETSARRLDFWFHGRGEKLSELAFIDDRSKRRGEFAPAGAFVLHPYGRYCNGSRFAGETDAWEALDDVRSRFRVDPERLVVRGFSLGGASCWHFAVHHASRWAAAAPGAGFSETAEFLRVFQNEKLAPAGWEQKLWRLHDATAHALNVGMVPLVAYSGENDRQIQAARAMEGALAAEELDLAHVIGAGAGHAYTPAARDEINRRLDAAVARGRDPLPRTVRFVTHTLRYPNMAWITLDELDQHWEPARVEASLEPAASRIRIGITNVSALTLAMSPGLAPLDPRLPVTIEIAGQTVQTARPRTDRSWTAQLHRVDGTWKSGPRPETGALRKRHGLQGPIDDAFMDSFLFVRPTGTARYPEVDQWVRREMERAAREWRRHYRGDVRIQDDTAVTDADRAAHHLILWGDPASNAELGRIADRLPLRWSPTGIDTRARTHAADRHVALLIHPHPAHPNRYVVLNSGFTFREYDYLNNARQTPKLPDWAIVDVRVPPDSRRPGGIVEAGFFGEDWKESPR